MIRSQDKKQRIRKAGELLRSDSKGITRSELARRLGISRQLLRDDLPDFDKAGVLLWEDKRGRLHLIEW